MSASIDRSAAWLLALTLLGSCTVGPSYHPPAAPSAATYKELVAAEGDAAGGWKLAQPNDAVIRDNWWELFDDPQLNALEQQVNVSNQNIAASFASFMQARALVKQARSQDFPTPTTTPRPGAPRGRQPLASASSSRTAAGSPVTSANGLYTDYSLPFDASWTPDLWGRVRNTVKGNIAAAQASAAD